MHIRVCCTRPGAISERTVEVPAGASAGAAVEAAGLVSLDPRPVIGVFGRVVSWDTVLSPEDRVEIYHSLPVPPRERRRARAEARRAARRD